MGVATRISRKSPGLRNAFDRHKAGITLEEYAHTFLQRIQQTRKHSTWVDHRKIIHHDLFPVFRGADLESISREKVKALAVTCLQNGQAPKTVQNTLRVLSSLLSHAKEDGLISDNPALRPSNILPKVSKRQAVEPLTREEVAIFFIWLTPKLHDSTSYSFVRFELG